MDIQNYITRKNIIILGVSILIVILAAVLLTTTFISVKAPENATITLFDKQGEVVKKEVTTGSLFYIGRVGDYTLKVSRLTTERQTLVKAGPLLNSFNVDLPENSNYSMTPVAPVNTDSFSLVSGNLVYLDNTTRSLKQVQSDDPTPKNLFGTYRLGTIEWASNNTGVTYDQSTNTLYSVNASLELAKMKSPDNINLTSDTAYAISPNGDIYVSEKNSVYMTTNKGEDYKKVASTDQAQVQIYPSTSGTFIVVDYPSSQPDNLEDPVATIISYNKDGKKLAEIKEVTRFNISISPNGEYVAMYKSTGYHSRESHASTEQETSSILTTKDFKPVLDMPTSNNPFFTWSDNSTVYYAYDRDVWKLSVGDSGLSELVARIPYGRFVQSIKWLSGSLYMSSYYDQDLASISKIEPGTPNETMLSLEVNLPARYDDCDITYVNINKPVVSGHPINIDASNCNQAAHGYLKLLNIPTEAIEVK